MDRDRIAALLAPFLKPEELSSKQMLAVGIYLDLLLQWNSRINLTAIRSPDDIVRRHFGESLFAARHLLPPGQEIPSVIDIGSGAGFPGIPLKIWDAGIALTLVEAHQKKATFLREVARALGLENVTVLAQRAETISNRADLVTLRAVEQFEQILPSARGLVKPGGKLALLVSAAQVKLAKSVLPDLGWRSETPIPLSRSRVLLVGQSQ